MNELGPLIKIENRTERVKKKYVLDEQNLLRINIVVLSLTNSNNKFTFIFTYLFLVGVHLMVLFVVNYERM